MRAAMTEPALLEAHDMVRPVTRIYADAIPAFAEAALESLYECPMTTLLRFRQYYCLDGAATYVAWHGGEIRALIVFRVEGRSVRVYNEQFHMEPDQLLAFVTAVYAHYPQVGRISLYAVAGRTEGIPFPSQKLHCLEKISFALPPTLAGYDALLSKNMMEKIRRSNKKLQSDFACTARRACGPGPGLEDMVRRIIGFNRMRMAVKKQACYHTEDETRKLLELVERYGQVYVIELDGEVRAGLILLRIGSSIAMHTVAHDPAYDRYNLGTLCCYHGIAHAIASGARHFDFGWGPYEYKYRLLGRHQDLHRIDIYRNRRALACDLPTLCRRRLEFLRRRFKAWVAHPRADEGATSLGLRRGVHAARAVRDRFR